VYGHGESLRDAGMGALAVAWSNWGYMGFALIPPLLGPQATATIIAAGLGDLTVILLVSLVLTTAGDAASTGGPKAALVAALHGVRKNPLIWAVVVGVAFSACGWALPPAADTFVRLLATGAGPVALFAIGVSLYRPAALPAVTSEMSAPKHPLLQADVLFLTVAKLIVHPYLLLLIAKLAGLSPEVTHVLVLVAALPSAGTVFLLATRHHANAERISSVILLTTALSFLTVSLMLYLVGAATKII
jgi:predicted permease